MKPIEMDNTPVPPRSADGIGSIIWRGRQWAVTDYGLERLDGTYPIPAERLDETKQSRPVHMAEKSWVDINEFASAWMIALLVHGFGGRMSKEEIFEPLRKMRRKRRISTVVPVNGVVQITGGQLSEYLKLNPD